MSKSESAKVTIVTPSLNQGQFIERTILSVLKQDYPNIEYIVVDGLSKDETPSILKKYSGQISKLVQEKDKSHGDAINKGFRLATGEIFAFLNSDDCYAHPGVVSNAVRAFLEHREFDVVYGRRRTIDANGFFVQEDPFAPFDEARLKRACYLAQEAVFWTKEVYERSGNCIDPSLKFAVDYDLWFRFMEKNAKFLAVDDVWGLYRYYPASKSGDIWLTVGFPEAKTMQEKYTGRGSTLLEMYEIHHQHIFGCDSRNYTEASWLNDRFCRNRNELHKTLLSNAPLDMWVHAQMPPMTFAQK